MNFRQLKKLGCEVIPKKYFMYPQAVARFVGCTDNGWVCKHLVIKGMGIKAHIVVWEIEQ